MWFTNRVFDSLNKHSVKFVVDNIGLVNIIFLRKETT